MAPKFDPTEIKISMFL